MVPEWEFVKQFLMTQYRLLIDSNDDQISVTIGVLSKEAERENI